MAKVVIIGSGASGVHFALSVLQKGYEVVMLDVGHAKAPAVNPGDTFNGLKTNLSDPVNYFLGREFESVIHPGTEGEYYGFPPNKSYVFKQPAAFKVKTRGFAPLFSFAQGGLAETWTGGSYPLNDADLNQFPFNYSDIAPYYAEVAKRVGIAGIEDDLSRFYPVHDNLMQPLRLDEHSKILLDAYEKHKSYLNGKLNCYMGRSRMAALSADKNGRKGCTYTGRCLWGCPSGAFYTPSLTLDECKQHGNFTYIPDVYVSHFEFNSHGEISSVVAESTISRETQKITADRYVLAAGTLSSSRIFMESVRRSTGEIIKLSGLMDNRQVLIPFINLEMLGRKYEPDSYLYHQIAMGFESLTSGQYFHALITTLKAAIIHPIVQNAPVDLRTALSVFRNVRSGLAMVNLNFPDSRRDSSFVTLDSDPSGRTKLSINYSPIENEKAVIKEALRVVRKALWKMNCIVPPGMMHLRPMGASVHYAGTIPMSTTRVPFTSSPNCQSNDFSNLYFADGTTFPSLPAKNLTFALMANAIRVADQAF